MKIVAIHNAYQQAGGEDVVFEQECQLLRCHGNQVITYQRTNRELEKISGLECLTLMQRIISAEDSRKAVSDLLKSEKPDLVHVHNTFMLVSPSVYQVCREARVPVVQTLHNYRLLCPAATLYRDGHVCEECTEHGLWRGIQHGCYRGSRATTAAVALMLKVHRVRRTWTEAVSGYIALSEFSRQKFVTGGLPAAKVTVKPNFVYPDPGERIDSGGYAIFVGRLASEKGVSTLLSAWEHLHSLIPLMIVGDGPLRPSLEAEAAQRKLKNVTFRGRLNRDETRDAIKHSAFLILPSLCFENFPMTIVEAFACGTPVLCSALGGMQELVSNQRTGLHFAPSDAADLARKATWAIDHPSEMYSMGRECRREYEARYTPEKNYSQLMKIYENTMASYA
jgi:glycosyltransferase involved in cell wall biosynthesis